MKSEQKEEEEKDVCKQAELLQMKTVNNTASSLCNVEDESR